MVVSVLSGKGGTGKTTIVAALSELARKVIKIDCDVDAPNLFLLYKGQDIEKKDWFKFDKYFEAPIPTSIIVICYK